MNKFWQILINVILYGVLVYFAYESIFVDFDPWFAFVVVFVLLLALVISIIPGWRAPGVSPGEYPFDD
jgi:ABC-type lipoprotein release transport system permease subunit